MGSSVTDSYAALAAAPGIFARSQDLTLAIEEEFQILDPSTLALSNRFVELKAAVDAAGLQDDSAGELIASEIEIKTGRCETFAEAAATLIERRAQLLRVGDEVGVELCALGVHPYSPWWEQEIIDTPHYRLVEGTLRYVAWRNNTFGIHVHVGVRDADRAISLTNALRPILPDLLALSAASPWYEGRRTYLHSTRTQLFTRMFPRCGIPDSFADWADYDRFVRWLLDTESILEHTQIWWCVRPHQAYGTVELRNADAVPDVAEALAVSAFAYAMAARHLRALDEGEPLPRIGPREIEENTWRAIRFGLGGKLIDWERGMRPVPAGERIRALLDWAAPEIRQHELERHVATIERMLDEGNVAQRIESALEAGGTIEEVYAHQVRETRDSVRRMQEDAHVG